MKTVIHSVLHALVLLGVLAADVALAGETFILATGRRDPRIYAIDFNAALKSRNNNTPNAIVSRSKVHQDRLDGTLVGDPANIVLSENNRTAWRKSFSMFVVPRFHFIWPPRASPPVRTGRGRAAARRPTRQAARRDRPRW